LTKTGYGNVNYTNTKRSTLYKKKKQFIKLPKLLKKQLRNGNKINGFFGLPQSIIKIITDKVINFRKTQNKLRKPSKPVTIGVAKLRNTGVLFNKLYRCGGVGNKFPTNLPVQASKKKINFLKKITMFLTKSKTFGIKKTKKTVNTVSYNKPTVFSNPTEFAFGLTNVLLNINTNFGFFHPQNMVVSDLKRLFDRMVNQFNRGFNKNNYIFTILLLTIFLDTNIWTSYLNKIFYRTPFYRQRRLFYLLRKLIKPTVRTCASHSNILGIYFSFRGKIATKAGLRKKVLRSSAGKYSSSNFGLQHKYRFKQVWSQSGAIGLKTIITVGPHHRTNQNKSPRHCE